VARSAIRWSTERKLVDLLTARRTRKAQRRRNTIAIVTRRSKSTP
jgi:hypothetical protein